MKLVYPLIFVFFATALLYSSGPDSTLASSDSLPGAERMKSFYIGFSHYTGEQELITLEITDVDASLEMPSFNYTMNSINSVQKGQGFYNQVEQWIELENRDKAAVSLSDSGKIILESVSRDSANYWKLEEK
jgi:hypothetical protein